MSEAPLNTAALDPRHQLIVMEQLRAVARGGAAVLAVMHDLMLAARFADRVLVMDEGRMAVDAAPAAALSPEIIARVFGVDASVIDIDGMRAPILRAPRVRAD
jgi:iron complex transport system ATP-binding protein